MIAQWREAHRQEAIMIFGIGYTNLNKKVTYYIENDNYNYRNEHCDNEIIIAMNINNKYK